MPISWSRLFGLSPSRAIAVNCGASHVAVARFSLSLHGKVRLEWYWSAPLAPSLNEGRPWSRLIGEALNYFATNSLVRGAVQIVLSGQYTLLKFVRGTRSEGIGTDGLLEFEAQRAIPCSLDEVTWDYALVSEAEGDVERVLAAAKRKNTEALVEEISPKGMRVERVLPASLALLRSFRYNYPELQERVLLVSVGARCTSLVFVDHGRYFARAFAPGGPHFTSDAATGRDQSEDRRAEPNPEILICQSSEETNAATRMAFAKFRERLGFEIERSIKHYCDRFRASPPAIFFLTGGGTTDEQLAEILANRCSCRVVRYDPLRNVEVTTANVRDALSVRPLPAELLGAALAHLQRGMDLPDLLPVEWKAKRRLHQRVRICCAAFVLGSAALLPPAFYWQVRLARSELNLAQVENQLIPARNLAAKNSRNLAALAKARSTLDLLQRATEKKDGWIYFIADLQQRLAQAEDVWLEELQPKVVGAESSSVPIRQTIVLGGRLLDTENPRSKVSPDSYQRILNLLRLLAQSPFVASVRDETFDNSQPGILRFHCVLELAPSRVL